MIDKEMKKYFGRENAWCACRLCICAIPADDCEAPGFTGKKEEMLRVRERDDQNHL